MEIWKSEVEGTESFVEAISEGRIVRVPEEFARMEGLPILRKPMKEIKREEPRPEKGFEKKESTKVIRDDIRKPLNWRSNKVMAELKENFQWDLLKKRRELGFTRSKVAKMTGISDGDLRLLENGVLPRDDFVLINKLQDFFGISLRKDGSSFNQSMRKLVEDKKVDEKRVLDEVKAKMGGKEPQKKENQDLGTDDLLGDIEIID